MRTRNIGMKARMFILLLVACVTLGGTASFAEKIAPPTYANFNFQFKNEGSSTEMWLGQKRDFSVYIKNNAVQPIGKIAIISSIPSITSFSQLTYVSKNTENGLMYNQSNNKKTITYMPNALGNSVLSAASVFNVDDYNVNDDGTDGLAATAEPDDAHPVYNNAEVLHFTSDTVNVTVRNPFGISWSDWKEFNIWKWGYDYYTSINVNDLSNDSNVYMKNVKYKINNSGSFSQFSNGYLYREDSEDFDRLPSGTVVTFMYDVYNSDGSVLVMKDCTATSTKP